MRITLNAGDGEQRYHWLIKIRDAADAMIMAQAAVQHNSSLQSDYALANRQQISDICSVFSGGN